MPKAFLSHSSVQKKFVQQIAKDLNSFAVIDSKSFEEGLKNIDEIVGFINKVDLFVIFLSDDALNSNWVKDELEYARQRLESNELARIYPLIIDSNVNYTDSRIPDWLRTNYNLKHVLRTGKASRLIKRRLQEISWNIHPVLKERDTIFVGRNEEIRLLEERIDDLQKMNPLIIIASGLPKIGRRTFIKNALIKTNTIPKESYEFPSITLNSRESIEDFIVKIYDLGFSEEYDFPNLLETPLDKKIDLALKLIRDFQDFNEVILIEDTGGIIHHDRSFVNWFEDVLERWRSFELKDQTTICIASQFKPSHRVTIGYDDIFHIDLKELSKIETAGLLKRLSTIQNITIETSSLKEINESLNGFPEQVHYCVDLLLRLGEKSLLKEFNLVRDYQKSIFNSIVSEIESDDSCKTILSIMVEFDFISFDLLNEITSEINGSDLEKIVENLIGRSIVETIGTSKEYLRLNQGIKDFLLRAGYTINIQYREKLKKHIENYLNGSDFLNADLSDFFYSLKGALLNNFSFKNKLVLPSHYLKTMITLYEQDRNYKDVVILADRILERESKLDLSIAYEIRYWLCLALARLKNERLKTEVRYFRGADHNFLLGFYYRINGQAENALDRFQMALQDRPRFSRAQRELVRVLSYLELYDEALAHSQVNYENDKSNPYQIQAYFDCLLRRRDNYNQVEKIRSLLGELRALNTKKAKEMASMATADFELFINHNTEGALIMVNKALEEFSYSPYLLYKKFTIAEKAGNKFEMASTILKFEKAFKADNGNDQNTLYIMRAKLEAINGNRPKAIGIINNNLRGIPSRAKERLMESLGLV